MVSEKKIDRLTKESELNFYFEQALKDKHTRVEFIRKRNRQKVGVMIACKDPMDTNKVIVGFSLCHWLDDFDKINLGFVSKKDFGKFIAHRRAVKYRDHAFCVVYSDKLNGEKEIGTVYIPQTVHESLAKFVDGCYKYYKDKTFPVWVENYFPKEK